MKVPELRRAREAGSGPVTVLLLTGFIALVFAVVLVAAMTVAGQEKSQSQHAADAAALGGAHAVLDSVPGRLGSGFRGVGDIPGLVGGSGCSQVGRSGAAELASANDATLISYCWNVATDTVSASVRLNRGVEGEPAESAAKASSRFEADRCRLAPSFSVPTPEPTPTPTGTPSPGSTPTPQPTPPPPKPVDSWIDCGFGKIAVRYDVEDKRFTIKDLDDLADELDDLDPRLTA